MRDKNVGGLKIAVDNAALMRVLDGVADLRHKLQHLRWITPLLLDILKHAWPIDELHRNVRRANMLAVCRGDLCDTGGIDLRNARMIEAAE